MGIERARNGRLVVKERKRQWSKAKRTRFLDVVATTANAAAGCRAVGMSRTGLWRRLRSDPDFKALFLQVRDQAYERLELELLARATGASADPANPTMDDLAAPDAPVVVDERLALDLLRLRAGEERKARASRNTTPRATQAEVDAALLKRLDRIEAKLRAEPPAPAGDGPA